MSYLFRSPDAAFVPSAAALPAGADPRLLAFRGHALVHRENGAPLPTVSEARAAGLDLDEIIPLGTLEGRPVAFTVLAADATVPEGFATSSLRRLMFDSRQPASLVGAPTSDLPGLRPASWTPSTRFTLEGPLAFAAALASQLASFETTSRFCGGCGGPLVRKAGERAKRCEREDRDIYPPVAPCVIVLIHDGDRVVLARAARLPAGMFALVAGFVEPGETLEDCVRREVKEEVGLDVDDLRYVASQPWPFPSQVMVGFFARWAGGEIVADPSEIEEAAWFSIKDLPMIPPPFSVARYLIDEYARQSGSKGG